MGKLKLSCGVEVDPDKDVDYLTKSTRIVFDKDLPPERRSEASIINYKKIRHVLPGTIHPPVAEFKVIEDYKSPAPVTINENYFSFSVPKDREELLNYEADDQDFVWLEILNEERSKKNEPEIDLDDFEMVMDRLEKKSFIKVIGSFDADDPCDVCLDGSSWEGNALIYCSLCNLGLHQECYGVPVIPDGIYLCRNCEVSPTQPLDCCLCPISGGLLKAAGKKNQWAHVLCAKFIFETFFELPAFQDNVIGLEEAFKASEKRTCYLCGMKGVGACVRCTSKKCQKTFHAMCGRMAGLTLGGSEEKPKIHCHMHMPDKNCRSLKAKKKKMEEALKSVRELIQNPKKTGAGMLLILPSDIRSIEEEFNFPIADIAEYWYLRRKERHGAPLNRGMAFKIVQESKSDEGELEAPMDQEPEIEEETLEETEVPEEQIRRRLEAVDILEDVAAVLEDEMFVEEKLPQEGGIETDFEEREQEEHLEDEEATEEALEGIEAVELPENILEEYEMEGEEVPQGEESTQKKETNGGHEEDFQKDVTPILEISHISESSGDERTFNQEIGDILDYTEIHGSISDEGEQVAPVDQEPVIDEETLEETDAPEEQINCRLEAVEIPKDAPVVLENDEIFEEEDGMDTGDEANEQKELLEVTEEALEGIEAVEFPKNVLEEYETGGEEAPQEEESIQKNETNGGLEEDFNNDATPVLEISHGSESYSDDEFLANDDILDLSEDDGTKSDEGEVPVEQEPEIEGEILEETEAPEEQTYCRLAEIPMDTAVVLEKDGMFVEEVPQEGGIETDDEEWEQEDHLEDEKATEEELEDVETVKFPKNFLEEYEMKGEEATQKNTTNERVEENFQNGATAIPEISLSYASDFDGELPDNEGIGDTLEHIEDSFVLKDDVNNEVSDVLESEKLFKSDSDRETPEEMRPIESDSILDGSLTLEDVFESEDVVLEEDKVPDEMEDENLDEPEDNDSLSKQDVNEGSDVAEFPAENSGMDDEPLNQKEATEEVELNVDLNIDFLDTSINSDDVEKEYEEDDVLLKQNESFELLHDMETEAAVLKNDNLVFPGLDPLPNSVKEEDEEDSGDEIGAESEDVLLKPKERTVVEAEKTRAPADPQDSSDPLYLEESSDDDTDVDSPVASKPKSMDQLLKELKAMRISLDKGRVLVDVMRKREKEKLEYVKVSAQIFHDFMAPLPTLLMRVVDGFFDKDADKVFHEPVDCIGYDDVVKNPMDLSTMKAKLESGEIDSFEDLRSSFNLMIENCLLFNNPRSFYAKYGRNFRKFGDAFIKDAEERQKLLDEMCNEDGFGTKLFPNTERKRHRPLSLSATPSPQKDVDDEIDEESTIKKRNAQGGCSPPPPDVKRMRDED